MGTASIQQSRVNINQEMSTGPTDNGRMEQDVNIGGARASLTDGQFSAMGTDTNFANQQSFSSGNDGSLVPKQSTYGYESDYAPPSL